MKILSENKPELLQVFLAILNSSVEQSKLEEDFSVEYSSKKSKQ